MCEHQQGENIFTGNLCISFKHTSALAKDVPISGLSWVLCLPREPDAPTWDAWCQYESPRQRKRTIMASRFSKSSPWLPQVLHLHSRGVFGWDFKDIQPNPSKTASFFFTDTDWRAEKSPLQKTQLGRRQSSYQPHFCSADKLCSRNPLLPETFTQLVLFYEECFWAVGECKQLQVCLSGQDLRITLGSDSPSETHLRVAVTPTWHWGWHPGGWP